MSTHRNPILLGTEQNQDDGQTHLRIRPESLQEYIGQSREKEKLSLRIRAAKMRNEPLAHALLAGPPGLGKTTLANIISHEMGTKIHTLAGPNVDKKGDLAAILMNLQEGDVLFIDEIHRVPKHLEEVLYSAMEDFRLDVILGQGPAASTVKLDLPRFTLVGATTRTGLLSSPLRARFGVELRLNYYSIEELELILVRSASLVGMKLPSDSAKEIALRSRGTPRIANRILFMVRDFAQVMNETTMSYELTQKALQFFDLDPSGLDSMDRRILETIGRQFMGGPVGIETLSAALSENRETLEEVHEPFLIQSGFLQRTPRGRMTTPKAAELLGFPTNSEHSRGL